MKSPAEFNETLAKLRDRFAATAGNTVRAFSALADELQRTPTAPEVVDALRRELHRIHGTAGSYGFHEVSRRAGALELVAIRWQGDTLADRDRRASIIRQFARSLTGAFQGSSDGGQAGYTHRVLLVDVTDDLAAPLVAEAVHRGHAVERATSVEIESVIDRHRPDVVIAAGGAMPPLPDGVPVVMLGDVDPTVAAPGRVRVLDPGIGAAEVLRIAESLAAQTGLAGATLLVTDDDPRMLARDPGHELHRPDAGESGIAPDVVVVDDDPALADLLGDALANRGLTHRAYLNGPDALSGLLALQLRGRRPVVLMAIDLPGLDGFSLLERLRLERPRDFKVVFISAYASEGEQLRALRAGALDYIVKPVSLQVLMAKIADWRAHDEQA